MEPSVLQFLQKNILLVAVAVASGTLLVWPMLRRSSGGPWVSAVEATQLMNREDALVVDVRDAGAYASGHIIGARNVPAERVEALPPEVAKRKDRPIIVCCERGERAARAAAALRRQGFQRVLSLSGGLAAWRQAGLPVQK